ncbi:hypothetical protein NDU88_000362 [Pleurodeles waltl]|uniref:Secreted protein n=1 Tax=Pleurodeles waltl TaxID=8319 RepID=A0AAV7S9V5_PLEWA|nr:hypothetical protein NDU88_000362 [Pleurodeles waltl]
MKSALILAALLHGGRGCVRTRPRARNNKNNMRVPRAGRAVLGRSADFSCVEAACTLLITEQAGFASHLIQVPAGTTGDALLDASQDSLPAG